MTTSTLLKNTCYNAKTQTLLFYVIFTFAANCLMTSENFSCYGQPEIWLRKGSWQPIASARLRNNSTELTYPINSSACLNRSHPYITHVE